MAHLIITLTDAPPIKIDRDLWTELSRHEVKTWHRGQAGHCWLRVLQHGQDERVIVYGGTVVPDVPEKRFGQYLDFRPAAETLVKAIKEVGHQIHPDLAPGCISKLPAVEV